MTHRLTQWLGACSTATITGTSEARALLLLAAHHEVGEAAVAERFDAALPVAHPDLVAALMVLARQAALGGAARSVVESAGGGRQVAEFVANWPNTNRWMCM